jgi:hypothetical protein
MSYVGNVPTTAAFPFDQFSGNGSTTAFTLSYAPAGATSIIVSISGVVQNPNTYSVSGTTLTFTPAPPTGTNNIAVLYLGLPVVATLTPGNTAYFSSSVFTATASQTVFTPSGTYQVGFINVIRNGSQLAPADYTATNGTTVVLNNACTAGDIVVIEVYTLTSISNALPLTGGTVAGATTFNTGVNLAANSGNVGVGTTSPDSLSNFKFVDVGSSGTNQGVVQANNGTVKTAIYSNSTEGYLATRTNHNLNLQTNATTQATITTAGLFRFNSGYGSVATAYGCRAWVNWNGTGTVAIRASGNVSSITDNGTGNYTVNFTTAMPDANFSALATSNEEVGVPHYCNQTLPSTTTILIKTYNSSAAASDCTFISVGIFR